MNLDESVIMGTLPVPSRRDLMRRRVFGHTGLIFGASVLITIILVSLFAPWMTPYDPYEQELSLRLINPIWHESGTWTHPLGTDALGRDYLTRLFYGARVSLLIGASAVVISGLIGTLLGIAAGYFGGRVDMVAMFLVTTRLATPVFLVGLTVVAIVGGSLQVVVIVLGLMLWDRFAMVARSATQQVRSQDYIAAAVAIGCSTPRLFWSEILPNIMNALVVVATLEMANAILIEAALSFLGLGVQPPLPSWGLMVSEGKDYMFFTPWMVTLPGLALFTLVLGINLLGDGIRDVTAPENVS